MSSEKLRVSNPRLSETTVCLSLEGKEFRGERLTEGLWYVPGGPIGNVSIHGESGLLSVLMNTLLLLLLLVVMILLLDLLVLLVEALLVVAGAALLASLREVARLVEMWKVVEFALLVRSVRVVLLLPKRLRLLQVHLLAVGGNLLGSVFIRLFALVGVVGVVAGVALLGSVTLSAIGILPVSIGRRLLVGDVELGVGLGVVVVSIDLVLSVVGDVHRLLLGLLPGLKLLILLLILLLVGFHVVLEGVQ